MTPLAEEYVTPADQLNLLAPPLEIRGAQETSYTEQDATQECGGDSITEGVERYPRTETPEGDDGQPDTGLVRGECSQHTQENR